MAADERTWRIGEVATATGLTVRDLHHYDQLGLGGAPVGWSSSVHQRGPDAALSGHGHAAAGTLAGAGGHPASRADRRAQGYRPADRARGPADSDGTATPQAAHGGQGCR